MMAATMRVVVVTPEAEQYRGTATAVQVATVQGELGILPNHAPLLGLLPEKEQQLRIKNAEQTSTFLLQGGFVEVNNNTVTILATRISQI